jgi:hypothetical protein
MNHTILMNHTSNKLSSTGVDSDKAWYESPIFLFICTGLFLFCICHTPSKKSNTNINV